MSPSSPVPSPVYQLPSSVDLDFCSFISDISLVQTQVISGCGSVPICLHPLAAMPPGFSLTNKSDHVTIMLKNIHWSSITHNQIFKLCLTSKHFHPFKSGFSGSLIYKTNNKRAALEALPTPTPPPTRHLREDLRIQMENHSLGDKV